MPAAQSVLISCSRLVDLSGAEITTLEIAEAFRNLGWKVSVTSFEISPDFLDELNSLGAKYIDLASSSSFLSLRMFDLAWIHHYITAHRILPEPNLKFSKIIYSSLSHFDPLECPPLTSLKASKYLVHSEENLEHFVENYPELSTQTSVVNNSVLARYWKTDFPQSNNSLNRIAVVSNHPPREIYDLITLLKDEACHVDLFGIYGERLKVTPNLLREYDAVISIGKTAQYAIAAGVPIYCYDHFGGYGWITPDNFEHARKFNFSGRKGTQNLTATELRSDLYEGYTRAISQRLELFRKGKKYFVLENNIQSILNNLTEPSSKDISPSNSNILIRQSTIFTTLRREITFRDNLISDLKTLLTKEKDNATKQIVYRDELIKKIRVQLYDEKDNAQSQILYRDKMISELGQELEAEKKNARDQILYRDELIAKLQKQVEIVRLFSFPALRSFLKKLLR